MRPSASVFVLWRAGGERGGDEQAGDAPLQLQPHPLEGRPRGAARAPCPGFGEASCSPPGAHGKPHARLPDPPARPLPPPPHGPRLPPQGLATAVRYKGKETRGERGLYSSFDSANDFIVGYWRTIERNRLKVTARDARAGRPRRRGSFPSLRAAPERAADGAETLRSAALAQHGWEAQLENASGSDSACRTFLETLYNSGALPAVGRFAGGVLIWAASFRTSRGGGSPRQRTHKCLSFFSSAGIVRQPDRVAELIPEARRLLAQGRG